MRLVILALRNNLNVSGPLLGGCVEVPRPHTFTRISRYVASAGRTSSPPWRLITGKKRKYYLAGSTVSGRIGMLLLTVYCL